MRDLSRVRDMCDCESLVLLWLGKKEEAKGDGEGDCPGVRVGVGAICCLYICKHV